jgi:hypothetical protein
MSDAAATLAAQGCRVLPVDPATKRSLIPGGVGAASTDIEIVRRRFRAHPADAIRLATGNGVVVDDVDPKHGGTVSPDWRATLTGAVVAGGRHLWFCATRLVPCSPRSTPRDAWWFAAPSMRSRAIGRWGA